jgi:predicted nucleotide-binding protein (sugar kinase/HSP70/actin superfamily)
MAQLIYDDTGRLLFTKEMKEEYTILMPQMLPIHFGMFRKLLELEGYHVDQLNNDGRAVVDEGLKYVHNDTCYPALLVIGQFMDAIKHSGYDPHKVALFITQTGGGCRASNYIHLLRKALAKAGMEYVPVISVNLSGMEKNPGFSMTLPLIRKMVYGMMYGDMIMWVSNQVRPYEVEEGATDTMIAQWTQRLVDGFQNGKGMSRRQMRTLFDGICADFAAIPVQGEEKVRVGIVGEIYVKFSALGNNHLEQFLLSEGVEPVVPGLTDFMIFKIYNRVADVDLYGGKWVKKTFCQLFMSYIEACQQDMIAAIQKTGRFRAPGTFQQLHELIQGYLGDGNKMGEGWLLTAEMLELIHSGTNNIVCAQPFGCLPNHIVGKGMIRKLKDDHPNSNIVAIDYDPGATKINQENRIKLMLANAKGLVHLEATPVWEPADETEPEEIPALAGVELQG